jgi:hypothetical protein
MDRQPSASAPTWYREGSGTGNLEEGAIDPDLEIADRPHHLWNRPLPSYLLGHLQGDAARGHRVTESIFISCPSSPSWDGPRTLEQQALGGAEMIRWCIDGFGVERCMFESN